MVGRFNARQMAQTSTVDREDEQEQRRTEMTHRGQRALATIVSLLLVALLASAAVSQRGAGSPEAVAGETGSVAANARTSGDPAYDDIGADQGAGVVPGNARTSGDPVYDLIIEQPLQVDRLCPSMSSWIDENPSRADPAYEARPCTR